MKCHQNWNVTKTEMSPKLKCHQKWNVTKSEMSPKIKCHPNWNVTKTEMSPKLKCHQKWNITNTEMCYWATLIIFATSVKYTLTIMSILCMYVSNECVMKGSWVQT